MALYEDTIGVICEECYHVFYKEFHVYNVTNTDYSGGFNEQLVSGKLNKVTCPKCKAAFTFERPHLAYSLKKSYAVYGICDPSVRRMTSGRWRMYDLMKVKDMKFRLTDYLCEVSEKVKIFDAKLDDIAIEILKHKNFPQKYFEDKANYNLLFAGIDNENMIFEYIHSTGKVIETHKIPMSEYQPTSGEYEPPYREDGYILWTKIDNQYIKEIYHE